MSDRIAVMNRGRFEQLGDPESLYERPTTRFVAGFLGVSNLLAGTREGTTDGYSIVKLADDSRVRVPSSLLNGTDEVEIGVRPEKIRLTSADQPTPPGSNLLHGVIRDASYIGVSTQYIVEIRGGGAVTVYEQNVERATKAELWAPGEAVTLNWQPDHSFVIHDAGAQGVAEAS